MYLKILSLLIFIFFTACQTVTVRPEGGQYKQNVKTDYEQVHNFFLWGLVGKKYINVSAICPSRKVEQIQTQSSFWNRVVFVVTLGIYSPRTAKVWCGERVNRSGHYLKYDKTVPKPGGVINMPMQKSRSIDPGTIETENIKPPDSDLPQYEELE